MKPVPARLDVTFTALADPARLAVIALLRKRPQRSGELAEQLALSRPLMSKHLRVLRNAGLVEEIGVDDDMRARLYQLRPDPFSEMRAWLEDIEAFWSGQLAAFKAHAEQRYGKKKR